jgi:hypothetical protein
MLTIMPINTITPINNNIRKNNNINFKSVYAATPEMVQGSDPDTQKLYGQSLRGLGEDESIIDKVKNFFSSKSSTEELGKVRDIRNNLYNAANQNEVQKNLDLIA